jgi:hypothetical protein
MIALLVTFRQKVAAVALHVTAMSRTLANIASSKLLAREISQKLNLPNTFPLAERCVGYY